jgi:RNA polymerase sigma-70 factor, ECF subfamily
MNSSAPRHRIAAVSRPRLPGGQPIGSSDKTTMATNLDQNRTIEAAYCAHAAQLIRRLTVTTRNRAVAEDLTQEAFVRLVIEVNAGRIPDDTGAWLHRVGHNLAMSRGRRVAVANRRNGEITMPANAPSPETLTLQAELDSRLQAAVAGLGATDQRALILAASGYRGREIARSIGRTDGATRTLLCRARVKVRAVMLQAGAI